MMERFIFDINTPRLKYVRHLSLILLAVTTIWKGETASGQIFLGAGPEALGGAGRAAVSPLDAHFLNPAALTFSRGTNIGGAFQEGKIDTDSPINNYSFVITDNDPNTLLNGGVAYVTKRSSFPSHTIFDQDFSLDFAGHIVPTIAWGVQGHRLFRQDSGGPSFTKYNATVGLLALPVPFFGLAFVAYDVFGDDDQVLNPTLSVGMNIVILDIIRIRADGTRPELRNPEHTGILSLGTEFNLGYGCLLRVGGEWDNIQKQTYFTAGFGFEGPKLNIAYAYRNNVNVVGDTYHTFQTWLTF